jgi:hypothetical protein
MAQRLVSASKGALAIAPDFDPLQSLGSLFFGLASGREGMRRPLDCANALADGPPETASVYTTGLDLDR